MTTNWPAQTIEMRSIEALEPYANNARTHSPEQVDQIIASMEQFGWTNPILVDETGMILAGHGRIMAAKKMGIDEAPVMVAKGWTQAQKQAYVLADNQIALNSGWDEELLSLELKDLQELDFDLELLGFDDIGALILDDPSEGLTDPDFVPGAPETPVARLGDLWQLGRHRLMCGDITSAHAVEQLMDGQKADMVFTDPPYGMFLDTNYDGMFSKDTRHRKTGKRFKPVEGDHEDFDPNFINTIFDAFDYCKEIFLWGADYYIELIRNRNSGSWVVWDKRCDEQMDKVVGNTFELCWSKAKHKRRVARILWSGCNGMQKDDAKKRLHPAQKPVELVKWFFDYYSMADKRIVVDLFGGSGPTLIACEKTDKDCCMMEIEPTYCDIIITRWQNYTGEQATLDGQTYEDVAANRN